MAQFNLSGVIEDLDGNPVLDNDKPLTLWRICMQALRANDKADFATKYDRAELAMQIRDGDKEKINLSPEQVVEIKTLIGTYFSPEVVYAIKQVLDPDPPKEG